MFFYQNPVLIMFSSLNAMLIVDKHCCDVCRDEFPVSQIDRKSKQIKEQYRGKFYLQSIWGKLAISNTENIEICGWIKQNNKGRSDKMQFVCNFFHMCCIVNICRKFAFLISQGSVATCIRWGGYCRINFIANFIRLPTVQNFWKSVNIWQSYTECKGGNFFGTQCWLW